jgi:hypothetical protein
MGIQRYRRLKKRQRQRLLVNQSGKLTNWPMFFARKSPALDMAGPPENIAPMTRNGRILP